MKKILSLAILGWFILAYSPDTMAQKNPCDADCNVYFNDVFRMRCPSAEEVAGLNHLTIGEIDFDKGNVKLGGSSCGRQAAELIEKFRNEDLQQEQFLLKRYCSAAKGWVLKPGESCVHGGPPPCCKAEPGQVPWTRIDPSEAMRRYTAEQKKVYQDRLKEISSAISSCKLNENAGIEGELDNAYNTARDLLDQYKREYPNTYTERQSSFESRIERIRSSYQIELKKVSGPNRAQLKVYQDDLEKATRSLRDALSEADKTKKENKTADQQKKESSKSGKGKHGSDSTHSSSSTVPMVDPRIEANYQARKAQEAEFDSVKSITQGIMAIGMRAAAEDDSEDDDSPFYLKLNVGLGYTDIPITGNVVLSGTNNSGNPFTTKYSASTSTSNNIVKVSMLMSLFNNKFVNLKLNPFASWGNNADGIGLVFPGAIGEHTTWGGDASIGLGRRLRFTLNGEYVFRNGQYSYDSYPSTDALTTGSYAYSTIKYGPGLWYSLKGHDAFVEAMFYRENVSFLANTNAEVYSARVRLSVGMLSLDLEYGKNYPVAGVNSYPKSYESSESDYYAMTIMVPFKLVKK